MKYADSMNIKEAKKRGNAILARINASSTLKELEDALPFRVKPIHEDREPSEKQLKSFLEENIQEKILGPQCYKNEFGECIKFILLSFRKKLRELRKSDDKGSEPSVFRM